MSSATIRRLSRVAASATASVSGRFGSAARVIDARASTAVVRRGYRGQASDIAGWRSRGGLHPAMSPTPSWSTSELLNPPEGTVESAPIDEEKLRKVARQANIALPDEDAADDEEEEDDDPPTLAAVESPAEGALRGVNEVLRFVQALDKVDVEGVEPMWTVLDDEHAAPLRADEVAGARRRARASSPNASPPTGTWVLDGTRAEEGEEGWAASDRDELVNLAPDSSRAPFYVAPGTSAGTDDE